MGVARGGGTGRQGDRETEGRRERETEGQREGKNSRLPVFPSLHPSVPPSLRPPVHPYLRLSVPPSFGPCFSLHSPNLTPQALSQLPLAPPAGPTARAPAPRDS